MTASERRKGEGSVGQFMLGDKLGRGAFGDVFKGLDTETGCFVAVKQIALKKSGSSSGGFPEETMREVSLLKRLAHKNIVRYLNTVVTETHLNLVLEFIESGSLAQVLDRFGVFPEKLTLNYVRQVLAGLSYLHNQETPIVHLDIKAANLLITKEGIIKLADFGISAVVRGNSKAGDGPLDSAEGSPFWMAPEVITMEGFGTSADVWSLGCTIIELLSGVPPYFDTNGVTAMFRMVEDPHPPLPDPDDSSDLCRVFLLECFQKVPAKRPNCDVLTAHPWLAEKKTLKAEDYRGTLSRVRQFNSTRRKATMKSMSILTFFDSPDPEPEPDPEPDVGKDTDEAEVPPTVPAASLPRRRRRNNAKGTNSEGTADMPEHEGAQPESPTFKAMPIARMPPRARRTDPQQEHDWQYTALVSSATSRRNFVYAYTVFQVKVCVTYPKDLASVWEVERSFGDFTDFDSHLRAALRDPKTGAPRRSSQAISKESLVGLPGSEDQSFVADRRQGPHRDGGVALDELPLMPQMKFFGKTDQAYIDTIRDQLNTYLLELLQLPYACKHPLLLQFLDCSLDGYELE